MSLERRQYSDCEQTLYKSKAISLQKSLYLQGNHHTYGNLLRSEISPIRTGIHCANSLYL